MKSSWHQRALAALPGWLLLVSGMALLTMALLVQPWLELRELRWRRDVMALQAQQLALQAQDYRQFQAALAADDPVLLQRLAFAYLRLKPAGTQRLEESAVPPAPDQRGGLAASSMTVEAWLDRPIPRPGVDITPPARPRTTLVRIASGRPRLALIALAGLCFLGGLVPGSRNSVRPT